MIIESAVVGPMQVNCYVLAARENSQAIIIDPGAQERKILHLLHKHKLEPAFVVNTHGHYDHIGCDDKFAVPVYAHRLELDFLMDPDRNLSGMFALAYSVKSRLLGLEEGQKIGLPGLRLKVLHIPGHTPGGIALLLEEPAESIVFTGDSLFCRGIGRSDLRGGDEELLIRSIKEKLFCLEPQTIVYPGHGPFSTIGEEKKENPFLQ